MIAQYQNITVCTGEDVIIRQSGFLSGFLMLHQHFVFAVNRHKVFRLDQLQHQLLFLLRGMSCCMQIAQDGFCQYIGTGAKQLVDHLIDACSVARNRTGGKDNRIAWNQLDVAVSSIRNP